jgi:hypothetical protein
VDSVALARALAVLGDGARIEHVAPSRAWTAKRQRAPSMR